METRQYIGARYVPIIAENPWDASIEYEPLTVVMYQGNSYTSRTFVPIGIDISDTTYWALTGNYNAQVEAYRQEVLNLFEDFVELGDNVFNEKINRPHKLHGNLVIDYFYSDNMYIQGSCYIGNNKVVSYFSTDTDDGELICFNLASKSIEWQHTIEGYHGNALTYRPVDHCIYICGMASTDNVLMNKIIVVDVYHPSTIKGVIEAPVEGIYSIAYDTSTDTFYSINARGTTPGEANLLYEYEGVFETVKRTVALENYPSVHYAASSQGVQFAKDGIVYILAYGYSNHYIIGNKVDTGECVLLAEQPSVINMYRVVGESEALIYDFDNDRYLIGSAQSFAGYSSTTIAMIYEIDLFKSIDIVVPDVRGNSGYDSNEDRPIIDVDDSLLSTLAPYDGKSVNKLKSPQDAITLGLVLGKFVDIRVSATTTLHRLKMNGFKGVLRGLDSSHKITIDALTKLSGVTCEFLDCIFTGKIAYGTDYFQICADVLNDLSFLRCQFEDVDGIIAHIGGMDHNSIFVRESDCIFNSTKRKYFGSNGSEIITPDTIHFVEKQGSTFNPVADTYVYSGLSIENAFFEKALVRIRSSKNGAAAPVGIIISNSNTDISGTHLRYIYEPSTPAFQCMTPLFMLSRNSTWYVWVKYDANSTGETAYADIKKIDEGYV